MSILIIDNFDSFTYNLYQMIQDVSTDDVIVKRNDAVCFEEILRMKPKAIMLSPGPGHPSRHADFGVCRSIIEHAAELQCPILGVCLGHQGIAHVLGGDVVPAPQVVHGKTSEISVCSESPLFAGLDTGFSAMRYHSFVVCEDSLPAALKVTARDAGSGLIMAMEHEELPLFGLQFHPESIGTPNGQTILENFLSLC